jgi:hypothetical protein
MNLTTQTPAEIDGQLAEIWQSVDRAATTLAEARKSVRRYEKAGYTRDQAAAGRKVPAHLLERIEKAQAELEAAELVAAPFEAEYTRRGGWMRYFLCLSDGGHVHMRHCSTLRPTTWLTWLPELADASEDEMVAKHGMQACTHCFPSAPAHPLFGQQLAEAKAKAEAKAASRCSGSGTYDHGNERANLYSPRAVCTHCHQLVSITSTGKLRNHKPKED